MMEAPTLGRSVESRIPIKESFLLFFFIFDILIVYHKKVFKVLIIKIS